MAKKKKKKNVRKKSKRAFRLKLKDTTKHSIAQIFFFSLAGLVMVSFSRQGLLLQYLYNFLNVNFGWSKIFLPFIFLSFGLFVSKFKSVLSQANVVVGSLLFFVSISSITRAGVMGTAAWEGLVELVSPIGAFLIYVLIAFAGLIILFNTSVDQVAILMANAFRQYGIRNGLGKKGAGAAASGNGNAFRS